MTDATPMYDHATLAEALVAFQAEIGTVAKDAANPFFKSTYADLPAIKAEAQPVLARHGLAVTQKPGYLVVQHEGFKPEIFDTLTTELVHRKGERDKSTMILRPVKNDPQAQGSAITYAKRYAFQAVLGIVADVDDDGNAASAGPSPAQIRADAKAAEQAAAVVAAHKELQDASTEFGATPKEVVALFLEKTKTELAGSTNIPNLKRATEYYREELAKKALGAPEVAPE